MRAQCSVTNLTTNLVFNIPINCIYFHIKIIQKYLFFIIIIPKVVNLAPNLVSDSIIAVL